MKEFIQGLLVVCLLKYLGVTFGEFVVGSALVLTGVILWLWYDNSKYYADKRAREADWLAHDKASAAKSGGDMRPFDEILREIKAQG
jgi:hypothetical protein